MTRVRVSLVAVGLLAWLASAGEGAARPRIGLRVRIDPARRSAVGRVRIDVENPTDRPLDHLELWRYPARLARRSTALDEHNFYWAYPRSFDPGAMDLRDVTVDGEAVVPALRDHPIAGPGTLVVVPLREPLPPGGRARLEATFATRIPRRYGAFGCQGGGCTLAGGFYPMPVELGPAGFDETAPPARADIDVAVDFDGLDRKAGLPESLIDGARAREAHLVDAAWVTISVARHFEERAATRADARITYFHHGRASPAFLDGDRARMVVNDVREALDLLAELKLSVPPGTEIRLVEAPLRMELAQAQGGVVLVSDQIYRIFPLARFRKFHSFQLVRAVFDLLLERALAARERPEDLAWSPDVVASWLVDRYTVRYYRSREFAKDILRWVSFIPQIDSIIYAPQIPFATAYFNTLDEPDPTRDDLRRFDTDRPRGRVLYEKLRDLLGDGGIERLARTVFGGAPIREAAEAIRGGPLAWFFDQWLRPYPDVDYRFELLGAERSANNLRNRIRVYKRGPRPPIEPVEVRVTEWGGERHDLVWDGRGDETVLVVETRHAIRSVVLDPRGRLLERIAGVNDDLRLDDRRPAPTRFVYNNFGALFNFSTLALDLSLDFSFSRVYDLKNTFRLVLYRNETTTIGGLLGYYRSFGPKILPSRLASYFSTLLRVARLDSTFARQGETPQPGTRLSLQLGLGHDDRLFIWEPWSYWFGGVSANYALTILDTRDTFHQVTVTGDVGRLFPIVPGHGVAVEARVAATFGDLKVPSQALFVGGPDGLRGYQLDQLPGRAYAMVRGEYRHVFVHDLNLNLAYLAFLHGIAGAAFVEAAEIVPCDAPFINSVRSTSDPAHDLVHNLFVDAGYSLQLLGDLLGVAQTRFNVEVAVPLVKGSRSCFAPPGEAAAPYHSRLPFGLFVYFGPQW